MSSSNTTELVEQLVEDYANFAKVNWDDQIKNFRDGIEDAMIRLEEIQSILTMVKSGSADCMEQHLPKLQYIMDAVAVLGKKINTLMHIVEMIQTKLTMLEAAIDKEEAELGISDRFFGMRNPLSLFKKTQESTTSNTMQICKSLPIYRSDDYFKRN